MRIVLCSIVAAVFAACAGEPAGTQRSHELTTGTIEVPAGTEGIHCWYFEVDAPAASRVVGLSAVVGPTVHHLSLFLEDADGTTPAPRSCEGYESGWEMLYTAGWSTPPLRMPDGVGLPLGRRRLVLQGHFANASDVAVVSHLGVILVLDDDPALVPASLVVLGTSQISIPPGVTNHVVTARCPQPPDVTLAFAFPHMHALGRGYRLVAEAAAGETMLLDDAWGLAGQDYVALGGRDGLALDGRGLRMECRYDNPGAVPVTYGFAAEREMCQLVLIAYPLESSFHCIE